MVIEVSRREVLNNLIRFKDSLFHRKKQPLPPQEKGERSYTILLNRHTGDMRFAQKVSSLESHLDKKRREGPQDWKEARLIVFQVSADEIHFEVRDLQDQELKVQDLDPLAWRISNETLNVLNIKAKQTHPSSLEMLPEEAVLEDLSSIHIGSADEPENLPGWVGPLDRLQAEACLIGKPLGTFLIRKADSVALLALEQLSLTNDLPLVSYVLTVLERENKVAERLILQTKKGWILYGDEPNLDGYASYYPSIEALFHAIRSLARYPI